jgi:hypothetical protein
MTQKTAYNIGLAQVGWTEEQWALVMLLYSGSSWTLSIDQ